MRVSARGGGGARLCLAVFAALLLGLLPSSPSADAEERRLPKDAREIRLSFAPLVKEVAPAVVNIYTRRVVEQVVGSSLFSDPFFKQFFGEGFGFGERRRVRKRQNSLGSGVVVGAAGLIVTNHHVIAGADEIIVALSDRREFEAKLILDDERTDLAVLRIDTGDEDLPYLDLGDSDSLEVGDLVLAIGNPFNVGQTVTSGIVSATARTGVGITDFQSFIQTDAAINPGNSGGALVTMCGKIVGINTAIFSKSGGSHGIGFAIPVNMVRVVMESARQGLDHVMRPWLGAATQAVTAEIASTLELERPAGVLIRAVHPGGPADTAGLMVGDIVTAVGQRAVDDPDELEYRFGTRVVGGKLDLTVLRDGRELTRTVALRKAPEDPPRDDRELEGASPLAGATVANLSPALAEALGIDTLLAGVVVLDVAWRSPARRLKLRPGDRILRVNGTEVTDTKQLAGLVRVRRREWQLSVKRGRKVFNLVVQG